MGAVFGAGRSFGAQSAFAAAGVFFCKKRCLSVKQRSLFTTPFAAGKLVFRMGTMFFSRQTTSPHGSGVHGGKTLFPSGNAVLGAPSAFESAGVFFCKKQCFRLKQRSLFTTPFAAGKLVFRMVCGFHGRYRIPSRNGTRSPGGTRVRRSPRMPLKTCSSVRRSV